MARIPTTVLIIACLVVLVGTVTGPTAHHFQTTEPLSLSEPATEPTTDEIVAYESLPSAAQTAVDESLAEGETTVSRPGAAYEALNDVQYVLVDGGVHAVWLGGDGVEVGGAIGVLVRYLIAALAGAGLAVGITWLARGRRPVLATETLAPMLVGAGAGGYAMQLRFAATPHSWVAAWPPDGTLRAVFVVVFALPAVTLGFLQWVTRR